MGAFADYFASQAPAPEAAPVDDTPGQFRQGLRSGLSGAASQLQAFGGNVAEATGMDSLARAAYEGSRESQADAQANAPRVGSYKDVRDLRSGYDYVTGLLGQSIPQSAAAVVGGLAARTPAGRVLGATAANLPFEAGDVVQRQQDDPVSMQSGAGERLLHATGGGLASAAAQSVLPAAVASKLAGGASETAERATVGQVVRRGLRELPEAMAIEGGGELAGEAAKQAAVMQSNPDRQLDTDALLEAGIGGAVAGAPLHAAGVAGETARAVARSPGNTLSGVASKAKEAATSAVQAGRDRLAGVAGDTTGQPPSAPEAPTQVDLPDPVEAIRGIYDKGTQQARDFWDRVARREDVADLGAVAGQTAEQIKAKLPELDSQRFERIRTTADDLLTKAGLDPARREQLVAAMQDLTDRGNQAVVAGLKKGVDATSDFADRARGLVDAFASKAKGAEDGAGAKKSEDFSGVRQAIAAELVPALQKANPDIFTDSAALSQAAEGVRLAIDALQRGGKTELTSTQIARLIDTFGDETVNVLDAVHRALGRTSPEEAERFYGALNEIRAQQKDSDKTLGLMMRSLLPELQDVVKTSDLRRELAALRTWAQRSDRGGEADRFRTESLKFDLDTRYGKNADKILAAIEKEAKPKENVLAREDVETLGERELAALGDSIFYGPQKGGLAMHPDLDPAGDKGQARQAMARAEKQNPDRTVRFVSADELGHDHPDVQAKLKELQQSFTDAGKDVKEAARLAKEAVKQYGMAAAEGKSEPGTITKDNVRKVQVKSVEDVGRSKYEQPSVFKVDNTSYDAIALTKLIERQFKDEFNDADNRDARARTGRMFMTGVAALQDHLGKAFPIRDDLVIDHKGTTFGQVKGLDYTPQMKGEGGEHATASDLQNQLRSLRNEYMTALREGASEGRLERLLERAEKLKDRWRAVEHAERLQRIVEEAGRYEADPRGPLNELPDTAEGSKPEPIRTNETGNSREKDQGLGGTLPKDEETAAKSGPVKLTSGVLRDKLQKWVYNPPSAAAKAVAQKGLALLDHADVLTSKDKKGLAALLSEGTKASQVAGTINALYERYKGKFEGAADQPASTEAKVQTQAAKPAFRESDPIDEEFVKGKFPELKTTKEVDDYLLRAYKRFGELKAEDHRVLWDDNHPTNELPAAARKALAALGELFEGDSHADLGSFDPDFDPNTSRDREIRAMLRRAAPEVAGAGAPKGSLVGATGATRWTPNSPEIKEVRRYVDRVLGPQVKTALANIPHAGEYVNDTIRVSVYARNPTTVAFHESLHAFFEKLAGQGNSEVGKVLERAAMSAPIQNQLRTLLAGEQAALAQLRDPEEAAAYMYQFWAAGKLKVGTGVGSLFERIKQAIGKVLGIITNDQRAEAIMIYFHSGLFKTQGMGQPNAVARALLHSGRNEVLEKAKALTKPLVDVADALSTAGGQRLRDTGIPALRELADFMKVTGRESTDDAGFIPAARVERTQVMNDLGAKLRGFTQAQLQDALEAMQAGGKAVTPEGRLVQRVVQGKDGLLPTMLEYMRAAGVDVGKIQPRQDYFPRLYDAHYISRHQDAFQTVLEKHGLSSTDARAITQNLMATNGSEFTVETDRPGMQNLKLRKLGMIPDAELAPFMRKNLFEILGSYVTQATRRAEWARRFGDDGQGITRMLERAKAQGATSEQLDTARKFVRAVDGTLGDTISPAARRIMGNVIVYQNLRLLPLAIFSSVVDPLGIVVRGGTVRDAWSTFTRGVKEIPSSWKNDFKADADTELAATLGVIDDAMLADATSQLYMQGMVGDTVKKINDSLFRFNLMEGFNRSMRVGATQAAIRFIERHADGKASPHSVRWLSELGLQPGVKVDLADPKVRAAVNMWVDGAVLRPDAADKPIWMNDPHYMLFSHLKQFVYAFQETILKRVAHEFQQGNYAPAMALASYVPVMIASDLIKGLIQGGGDLPEWKKDWGPGDYVGSGIERAGLLGKAQFPVDGVGMLLGPTAQQAMGVAQALDGKAPGKVFLKALPGETLYSGWLGDEGSRVENSMSTD